MKLQTVLKAIRNADQDYNLIEPKDKLAVALSGGKDSMLMFLALSMYQKFEGKDFELCAIHVSIADHPEQDQLMQEFADKYHLDLHIEKTKIYDILNMEKNMKDGRIQCSLCSNLKKGVLMETAKNLGCNKVVFGHHGDDAMETLLMNMIHGARVSTFSPKQYMSRMDMTMIRPFVYLTEEQIIEVCRINQIPSVKPVCPNDGHSERQTMKEMLESIYRKYPDAHKNFMKALTNREADALWDPRNVKESRQADADDNTKASTGSSNIENNN